MLTIIAALATALNISTIQVHNTNDYPICGFQLVGQGSERLYFTDRIEAGGTYYTGIVHAGQSYVVDGVKGC